MEFTTLHHTHRISMDEEDSVLHELTENDNPN
jgi:hypothetical protein